MHLKNLLLITTIACLCGCTTTPPREGPNLTGKAAKNYAGIMSTAPRSYIPVRPTTFAVHTDEIGVVRRPTGDHTQYLWGLVTVADD